MPIEEKIPNLMARREYIRLGNLQVLEEGYIQELDDMRAIIVQEENEPDQRIIRAVNELMELMSERANKLMMRKEYWEKKL